MWCLFVCVCVCGMFIAMNNICDKTYRLCADAFQLDGYHTMSNNNMKTTTKTKEKMKHLHVTSHLIFI